MKSAIALLTALCLSACGSGAQSPAPRLGASLIYPGMQTARSLDSTLRLSIVNRADGLISQTFPRSAMTAGTVLVNGTAYYSSIPLMAGDPVSSIVIAVTAPGVTMSLSKVGLYTTAGVQLAVSADQGASWESTGYKSIAMIAPYTVPTSGVYYVGIIGSGATNATVARTAMVIPLVTSAAMAPGALLFGSETGQTDLDPTATITGATTTFYHWAAVK